jgi:hypothetical protein
MQEHVRKIKGFLEEYQNKAFTGGIKMGFEEGKPMTFWISSVPDFKNKPIEEGFDLEKMLKMAANGSFTGSLFFLLEGGEIKHFYYNETIQGRKLLEKLDGYRAMVSRTPEKRVVVALRSKR